MKKVKLIYNPSSGENSVVDKLDEMIALYQKAGYTLIPYRLVFDGSERGAVEGLNHTYHHLIIAGGDGTVNFLINLLKENGIDIPVAILPSGTANDFASALGMPHDLIKACRAVLSGVVRRIDLGRVNGQWFANVFSCGLFSDISQKTPTAMKNTFGRLAYYAAGVGDLVRLRKLHIRVESDGGDYEGSSVVFFVFNGRTAGKLKLAYLSEIDDGLLDILILKGDNHVENLQTVIHYLTLPFQPKQYPPGMEHIRCTHMRAVCETREPTDIDGQPGPDLPVEITCERGALRVICPAPGPAAPRRKKGR